ncbi:ImmA/IrrE family metallo-endopeptidase [Mesorhizobium sp. M0601]|uniref:ImmA/IrrE family metallo-endopeptidase n=1 Tax=unclassified Mesorhizobium TaxID=325217 RepID=UPI00333C75B4
MTRTADKKMAKEAARQLLTRHGVKSAPVPVERIAKTLGVRVEYAPLDGELSGLAHVRDGVPIVGINTLHAPNRQRFTLAHELAHIQLHRPELEHAVHVDRGSLRRDAVTATGTDPNEIEANTFAAELLMPRDLLLAMLDGRSVDLEDDDAVAALAKRFRVSEAAMRFRLGSLGDPG